MFSEIEQILKRELEGSPVRESIERDIEEIKNKEDVHEENWVFAYFNNVHAILPFSWRRRNILEEHLNMKREGEETTEKSRKTTYRQFFYEVDDLILRCGLNLEELEEIYTDYTSEDMVELYLYLIPIYVILRERGYNHLDLTA